MTNAATEGLDLTNLFATSQEEIDAKLSFVWRNRHSLYEMSAYSLMLDYAPEFGKLHGWGRPDFSWDTGGRSQSQITKLNIIKLSLLTFHNYIYVGWETGVRNEFFSLWRMGFTKSQLMELVMFTQLYAGMRGLGHVYHAVGDYLPVLAEPEGDPEFSDGWAVDPDAMKCGLDFTTRECTAADRKNLTDWYEKTIGYVPNSIVFGLKHHPEFIKVNRAKWEVVIKTLPKQIIPFIQISHHTFTGNRDGIREAALLGKAWGLTSRLIVEAVTSSAYYYCGFEGMYAAHDAIEDLL